MTTKEILIGFEELANDYKNLSLKYFGWKTTYVDMGEMRITDELTDSDQYRFYFAAASDFSSFNVNGVEIAFHDVPEVAFKMDKLDLLEDLYKTACSHFFTIKRNMAK